MDAVIFDLFGTLVPDLPRKSWLAVYAEIAALLDVEADAYAREWERHFPMRMDGTHREPQDQFRAVLRVLDREAPKDRLDRAAELKEHFMLVALTPKPEALECLQGLRDRGVKLGLATDCSWETPALLDRTPLGAYFPVRAASAHVGVRKPDERMYRHVLNGLSVEGNRCFYVGDGNSNELIGARRHGMITIWVDNGDHQGFKDNWAPGGEHTVRDLREILTLVDARRNRPQGRQAS